MGERQHYCVPQSSCSLRRGLYNYVDCAVSYTWGSLREGGRLRPFVLGCTVCWGGAKQF